MPRARSLFRTQTAALLARTWHWQRRQYCSLACNFVFPPLALVLLFVLQRAITADRVVSLPFQRDPRGAFAARPFDPARCLDAVPPRVAAQTALDRCAARPFAPPYRVPVFAPQSLAALAGARDARAPAVDAGLLAGLSLQPFIYPPAVPGHPRSDFAQTQTSYDGVFLHSYFDGNDTNPIYLQFLDAQRDDRIDQEYHVQTVPVSSPQQLLSKLYDDWFAGDLFAPYSTAFSFHSLSQTDDAISLSATVFYNESTTTNCTVACPLLSNIIRLESAVFRAIAPTKSATAFLRRMPPIDVETDLRVIQLFISIIIGLTSHFLFPTFLRFLVYERVATLRSIMAVMGLRRPQYWFGTYIGLLIQYSLAIILVCLVGAAVSIPFYADNTPISYLVLFFLWGNVLIAMAMLFAPFFNNPETAQTVAWLFVFLVSLVGGPMIGRRLSDDDTSEATWAAIMLLPSFAFMRSLYYAGAINSGGKGITLGSQVYRDVELGMCSGDAPFCRSYAFLAVEWLVIMLLAFYFDRVLPSAQGGRLHPLFFLGFKRKIKISDELAHDSLSDKGADVLEEDARARSIVANMQDEPFDGVVLDRLSKTYHGKPPVKALQNLSLVARKDEVLCILAHNGAGKTTAFRTLIGELEATSGAAFVCGYSILNEMDKVHRNLGVAPQQNILWDVMTVQEHLFFYGRVKNLFAKELKDAVEESLESVQLTFARRRQVRALSGGMKRRLSVSIAMIGKPDFIILDEPSTGLDILAREKLWDTINRVKHNRTIMLTTHSLEEAETLSNRVAIMSQGQLMCIGKAEELKLRLGKGHHLSVSLPAANMGALHDAIMSIAPEASIETQLGGSVDYVLPRSFAIAEIFSLMATRRSDLEIRDWSVNQSTLEDVFLRVTHASRRETAKEDELDFP